MQRIDMSLVMLSAFPVKRKITKWFKSGTARRFLNFESTLPCNSGLSCLYSDIYFSDRYFCKAQKIIWSKLLTLACYISKYYWEWIYSTCKWLLTWKMVNSFDSIIFSIAFGVASIIWEIEWLIKLVLEVKLRFGIGVISTAESSRVWNYIKKENQVHVKLHTLSTTETVDTVNKLFVKSLRPFNSFFTW